MTRTIPTTAIIFATLVAALLICGSSMGMPPHPNLVDGTAAEGTIDLRRADSKPVGLDEPDDFFIKYLNKKDRRGTDAALAPSAGPFRILALLVDFSDHVSSVSASFFDSLVFDSNGATVNDYFDEISYSQIDLVTVHLPSSVGWTRAPQTYAYYVDGQRGIYGTYPQNSQGLVNDLIGLVDPVVDFGPYDNDGDGTLDVLLVIHSGTGAEMSGSDNDIHSHKWSLPWPGVTLDGVQIYTYTVQPEYWLSAGDMTIGVYAHELCHGFGLPDLYDTDYSSNGIGDWGIMSFGSWNGPSNRGGSPAHPSAWSRIQMGFSTPTTIAANQTGVTISPTETGGIIYRLPLVGGTAGEYILVENRQQIGYDAYLPSSGLLIWHVDTAKGDNSEEWWPGQLNSTHYKVALEQADGRWDIEQSTITGNTGDIGDPYPGSTNNTSFSAGSTPSSDSYTAGSSVTSVTNINFVSQAGYADFFVGVVAGVEDGDGGRLPQSAVLSQNYPNPFNPSTTFEFSLARDGDVQLSIYNLLGQEVSTIIDGRVDAGTTRVIWEAVDDSGTPLASGVYFYVLKTDETVESKKMVLVR